ncbi:redoxin domain-containing protein [bacterium]|nr:redoxin domain-containing protein [bacterium]
MKKWQFMLGILVLILAYTIGMADAIAQSEWQDAADEHAEQVADAVAQEDNPAWEKYAFELDYIDGSGALTFADIAREGKPFILFFWLSDCPLCHLQLPQVQQLQDTVDAEDIDLRIVAVNVDFGDKDALDFYTEKEMTFKLLHDSRARATDEAFHLNDLGCPLIYVFNEKGELVDYLTGYRAQLEKTVFNMLDITPANSARTAH